MLSETLSVAAKACGDILSVHPRRDQPCRRCLLIRKRGRQQCCCLLDVPSYHRLIQTKNQTQRTAQKRSPVFRDFVLPPPSPPPPRREGERERGKARRPDRIIHPLPRARRQTGRLDSLLSLHPALGGRRPPAPAALVAEFLERRRPACRPLGDDL